MSGLSGSIAALIETHEAWAVPIIGLIAFGESLAIVGLLIPATAIMVLMGGLVGAGVLDPVPILLATVVGATLGDAVSYYIGRWFGRGILGWRPLRTHRHSIALARLFFRRYGTATVFFGRFLGPVRSTVPLVAGVLKMGHGRFQIANAGSAIVWAPLMLTPGWLAAQGFERAGGLLGGHGLAALAAFTIASIVLGLYAARRLSSPAPRPRRALRSAP